MNSRKAYHTNFFLTIFKLLLNCNVLFGWLAEKTTNL